MADFNLEHRARLEEISNRAEAARGPIDAALATIDHLTTRKAELDQECQFSMKAIAQEQERAEKAEAEVERLTARCERLNAALIRQCDNMAFIVNHVDLNGWYEKCRVDLENDRAALTPGEEPAYYPDRFEDQNIETERGDFSVRLNRYRTVAPTPPADVDMLVEEARSLTEDDFYTHPNKTFVVLNAVTDALAAALQSAPRVRGDVTDALRKCCMALWQPPYPKPGSDRYAAYQAARWAEDALNATPPVWAADDPEIGGAEDHVPTPAPSTVEQRSGELAETIERIMDMDAPGEWVHGSFTVFKARVIPAVLALWPDRARLISAMQEHLSPVYEDDHKGNASWSVTGFEEVLKALGLGE